MQHNYEAELNEACQVLGYMSYKHFYDTEKKEMIPEVLRSPSTIRDTWYWLLDKIVMHPHFDFSHFIYPLVYARYGVWFRVCGVDDLYDPKVELHTIMINPVGPCLEQMRWLAYDPTGPVHLEEKMGEYLNTFEDGKRVILRFWDYTIASAYAVSNTIRNVTDGKIPVLYII